MKIILEDRKLVKPNYYVHWKSKQDYVPIRFFDPVTYYQAKLKIPTKQIKHLLKVYDGVMGHSRVSLILKKYWKENKWDLSGRYTWSKILLYYYKDYMEEKFPAKMNVYKFDKLIGFYEKWKQWRYFGRPMVTADDFDDPKYFEEYKIAFNKHNKNKFVVW